jgi:hypothetical protein
MKMRMLVIAKSPLEPFNAYAKDGSAGAKIQAIVDEIKPEAVYFTEMDGHRTAVMIVDMDDPSKIPSLAEPWFLTFNSNVEFHPVMSPEDLARAGLEELGKKWG